MNPIRIRQREGPSHVRVRASFTVVADPDYSVLHNTTKVILLEEELI
jgi:hypothetical protein